MMGLHDQSSLVVRLQELAGFGIPYRKRAVRPGYPPLEGAPVRITPNAILAAGFDPAENLCAPEWDD